MKYRKIPNTNLEISEIALGTWVFGGDNWSGVDEKDCIEAIYTAYDTGINLIDTAPIYGLGKSEEIIGRVFKNKSLRKKFILATKCGLKKVNNRIINCLKPESIKEEIEASLKRLQTEYIDIYQIHWPDKDTALEETLYFLLDLKKQGKIGHIGVCNFDLELLKKAKSIAPIVSVQNEYSLIRRKMGIEVFDFCLKEGVAFLAYGCLGGGILSGKYREPKKFNSSDARSFFYNFYTPENFSLLKDLLLKLETLAQKYGCLESQIALAWVLKEKAVTSCLVGCRNSLQVKLNSPASDLDLSEEDKISLDEFNFPTFL
ncbi:MAG: aldo/keto reductase [Candidatus Omnitrophica bacterium]|nr:aldo/keto reductase [Candidatus Omnitrophota bacterium]